MRNVVIIFTAFILLSACESSSNEDKIKSDQVIEKDTLLKDTKQISIQEEIVKQSEKIDTLRLVGTKAPKEIGRPLILYPLHGGFIPLTDDYEYSETPESSVIEKKYLSGDYGFEDSYHILSETNRKKFIERMYLYDSVSVFVFDYSKDTVYTLKMNQLKIVAYLTPYEVYEISHRDFYIGIEVDKKLIDNSTECLVNIGYKNIFKSNNVKAFEWKTIDSSLFPNVDVPINREVNVILREQYSDSFDSLIYFVRDFQEIQEGVMIRQVVVTNFDTTKALFNKVFEESEFGYLNPLNKSEGHRNRNFQYLGSFIEGYPPGLFGFSDNSAGCSYIYYINEEHTIEKTRILCDNRH